MAALATAFFTAALAFGAKIYFDFWAGHRDRRSVAASLAGEMSAYIELLDIPRLIMGLQQIAMADYASRQHLLRVFFTLPVTNPVFDKVADRIGLLSTELATDISKFYNVVAGYRLMIGNFSSEKFLGLPDELQVTSIEYAVQGLSRYIAPADSIVERLKYISTEDFKDYAQSVSSIRSITSTLMIKPRVLHRRVREILGRARDKVELDCASDLKGLCIKESNMPDTTIIKVDSAHSPRGKDGQIYLATGKNISMRLWKDEQPGKPKTPVAREYDTAGYVIAGRAELWLEGQTVTLAPGDSWIVPSGASHSYRILESFTAVEATTPPAAVHDRDAPAPA